MVEVDEQRLMDPQSGTSDRDWARARVERRRKLEAHFVAYLIINAALVAVWALTGFGYFWPGWVLGWWGAFLLVDALNLRYRRPITDEEIDEELRRAR